MDTNDFVGSFAQENVSFTTRVVKTSQVGDNYWKVMVFIENDRFVDTSTADWELVPGSSSIKALSVSASDYASYTSGLLRSWLYDLFCTGFTGDCILVACASHSAGSTVIVYSSDGSTFYSDDAMTQPVTIPAGKTPVATGTPSQYSYTDDPSSDEFITAMDTAYELMKAYAYHKTVCAMPIQPTSSEATAIDTSVAVELATLCAADKGLLSSAPYFPFTTSTPQDVTSDPLYMALKNASKDAFFSAHQDATRNASLYSLGLAMSELNGSGTCVGNSLDMVKSAMITSSGPGGTNLTKSVRGILKNANIQSFKPVGDNSGNVAAIGASTINGDVVQATWIISYITFMTKIDVAKMITTANFLKNASNYTKILNVLRTYLAPFGESGSGRLRNISITAPAFGSIASEADVIVIPDAWSARYVDQVREVQITGTLYIGEE